MNELLIMDDHELSEAITQMMKSENQDIEDLVNALQEAENRGFETIGEVQV